MKQDESGRARRGNFDGLRVIDFAHILSGPYPCKLMADMGAEVIKVETPVTGERTRSSPYIKNGVSGFFLYRNSSKRSVSIDMKKPEGVEVFKDLVRVSDIMVQNMRVGVMDRLGVGWDVLKQINPRLIMVSVSGYGQYGPLSDRGANDANLQALSGATALGGHPDGPPLPSWVPWVDFGTGTHALAAIGAALYYRNRTGKGQHIDIAMLDVAFTYHDFAVEEYIMSDGKVHRTRTGAIHPSLAILGVYKCRDDYLLVSGRNWAGMAELLGRPELATDPRFDTNLHRIDHKEEVYNLIAEWIKDYDAEEAKAMLEAAGMLGTDIQSLEEAIHHPQVEARELFVEVDHPQVGRMKTPNTPIKFSETEARVRFRAPLLGEHNDEVLSGVLGYSRERIAGLWERRVLYAEPAVGSL